MTAPEPAPPDVRLRPWRAGDEEALVRIANDRAVWINMSNRFPHPYTRADAEAWVAKAAQPSPDQRHLAIVFGSELAGGLGWTRLPDLRTRTAEIGYWLGQPYWGRGIATEALRQGSAQAFRDFDFVRLQASVIDWNPASRRVLEKAGYTLEARHRQQGFKDDRVCDLFLYALLRCRTP